MFNFRSYFCFKPIFPKKACVRGGVATCCKKQEPEKGEAYAVGYVVRLLYHIIHPILTRANIVKYSEKSKRFGIMPC